MTVYRSVYVNYFSIVSLCILGVALGKAGESCVKYCGKIEIEKIGNFSCDANIETNNNTHLFEEAELHCEDNTTQAKYKEKYHPSYNSKDKRCEGFQGVPKEIDCSSSPDDLTNRICNCISPCKYRYVHIVVILLH